MKWNDFLAKSRGFVAGTALALGTVGAVGGVIGVGNNLWRALMDNKQDAMADVGKCAALAVGSGVAALFAANRKSINLLTGGFVDKSFAQADIEADVERNGVRLSVGKDGGLREKAPTI